jgi:hypothetical protein
MSDIQGQHLQKGTRVRLSVAGRSHYGTTSDKQGTVVSGLHDVDCVAVLWDGRHACTTIHVSFLEPEGQA